MIIKGVAYVKVLALRPIYVFINLLFMLTGLKSYFFMKQFIRSRQKNTCFFLKVWLIFPIQIRAGVAQLVEQLICNQQVAGSSPIASSRVVL